MFANAAWSFQLTCFVLNLSFFFFFSFSCTHSSPFVHILTHTLALNLIAVAEWTSIVTWGIRSEHQQVQCRLLRCIRSMIYLGCQCKLFSSSPELTMLIQVYGATETRYSREEKHNSFHLYNTKANPGKYFYQFFREAILKSTEEFTI